jgi:hypothetical protein
MRDKNATPNAADSSRLAEIRARLEAATPGPWSRDPGPETELGTDLWYDRLYSDRSQPDGFVYIHPVTKPEDELWIAEVFQNEQDADLISHAPADIAWLLDEVERLEKRVRMYEVVKS